MERQLPTADADATLAQRLLQPLGIVLATLAVAVVGWAAVGGLDRGHPAPFTPGPAYSLWRILLGVTAGIAVAAAVFAIPRFLSLRTRYPSASLSALTVLYLLAIAVTALVPRMIGGRIGPSSIRIAVVLVIAAAALWPAAAIIWIVRARVRFVARQTLDSLATTAAHRIEELRYLRSMLITALTILATVVSMSVINTGQLRNARVAAGTAGDYPPAYALLYGAYLAALLAILFIPAHLTWQAAGERVLDAAYPIVRTGAGDTTGLPDGDWEAGRKRLSELIGLSHTATSQFRAAFTTLSPFLTGLLAYFLK
ncbi:hypothetical protein ACW9HR_37395 [Nocardia gipuzkoensis]